MAIAKELLLDNSIVLNSEDIFNLACEMAYNEFQPENTGLVLSVGIVDLSRVAFDLQDENTVSLIVGDEEFAQHLENKAVITLIPEE